MKKNFDNSNTDSYIAHNETVTPLNIATPKISLKEKFDSLKVKFIDDFESIKDLFFFFFLGNKFIQNGNVPGYIERLIKQLQDEVIFFREELRNKNDTIKCVLDQLSKVMELAVQILSVLVIEIS